MNDNILYFVWSFLWSVILIIDVCSYIKRIQIAEEEANRYDYMLKRIERIIERMEKENDN